jgi:restriction system protein
LPALLNEALAAVRGLKWHNFELLVAEGFRGQGFSVTEVAAADVAADQVEGPDLVLVKAERRYCVRCRGWQEAAVGADEVRRLRADMAARGAGGGFIVTAGEVADDVLALAQQGGIQFVKGAKLLAMIDKARETITSGLPAHARWGETTLPGTRS